MRYGARFGIVVVAAAALPCVLAGCATSSHRSIRVYEYSEEPRPAQVTDDEPSSEYQMQSPGKMVSPGEMVPPGEMVDDQ